MVCKFSATNCSHEIKRHLLLGRKAMTNQNSVLKSRDISLPTKVNIVKAMVFLAVMYGFESWTIRLSAKDWCFWSVMLEKTLESPLDWKEIKLVNPKGNQPWIFIGRTDAEAPIFWPPDARSLLIGKDPDDGKDWRQRRRWQDEMVRWYHRLNGPEFEQTQEDSEGQESLECCSPWSRKKLDTTLRLNNKSSKRC